MASIAKTPRSRAAAAMHPSGPSPRQTGRRLEQANQLARGQVPLVEVVGGRQTSEAPVDSALRELMTTKTRLALD
jgi:hypothetical protein